MVNVGMNIHVIVTRLHQLVWEGGSRLNFTTLTFWLKVVTSTPLKIDPRLGHLWWVGGWMSLQVISERVLDIEDQEGEYLALWATLLIGLGTLVYLVVPRQKNRRQEIVVPSGFTVFVGYGSNTR